MALSGSLPQINLGVQGFLGISLPPERQLGEAGVKSFKFYLKRAVENLKMTLRILPTIITQIEGILNSRSIIPLSEDIDDLEVLTPGHFSIGRSIISLSEPNLLDNTGRPRVTTPQEDWYLAVTAKRKRWSTASDLSRQLSSDTGTTVSKQAVYRRLRHIGLYARRTVRCVPRTATHCRLRLTWSREHALWTPQHWSFVMFSDESRFSLHSDSRRTLICKAQVPVTTKRIPLNDTIKVVHYGSFGEEFFSPELTCMFRV
ncbi:HTH_Tnp_Tc3_2 domain-containing protein [Trichonephila clavipes]|nr:HTH_Tnp_Tc3_2 domain-containing protein [Trichonephila clavipes]